MLLEMRHAGIVVRDMERMRAFYRDFLGLTEAIDFRERGDFIDTVQGLRGVDVRMVKLKLADGAMIELLEDSGHPVSDTSHRRLCDAGLTHLAFTVADVEEVYRRFQSAGLETLSLPVASPDGKARLFFARDPEGNLMELVEMVGGQSQGA
ncbi:MAG: VOC family protein [Planctomycetota bacterium]